MTPYSQWCHPGPGRRGDLSDETPPPSARAPVCCWGPHWSRRYSESVWRDLRTCGQEGGLMRRANTGEEVLTLQLVTGFGRVKPPRGDLCWTMRHLLSTWVCWGSRHSWCQLDSGQPPLQCENSPLAQLKNTKQKQNHLLQPNRSIKQKNCQTKSMLCSYLNFLSAARSKLNLCRGWSFPLSSSFYSR